MGLQELTETKQFLTFTLSDEIFAVEIAKVREVLELEQGQIGPAPKIGTRLKTEFIYGMGKRNDSFIIILNIDKVFSADELHLESIPQDVRDLEHAQ